MVNITVNLIINSMVILTVNLMVESIMVNMMVES